MRKLRFHESRLLRKTNFLHYPITNDQEYKLISMYQIENRESLVKYRRIIGMVREIAHSLAAHKQNKTDTNTVIDDLTRSLTTKLHSFGLIRKNSLLDAFKLRISDLCERRITTLLKRQNFTNSIKEGVKLVEQGHIMIGNKQIISTDTLVTAGMENFIKWKDGSKHKQCIDRFNDCLDEYQG